MIYGLIEFVGDLLYGRKGSSRLEVHAVVEGDTVTLTLENKGNRKLGFAAVQVRDNDGKRHFPQTDLAARTTLAPDLPIKVSFRLSELDDITMRSVEVLDTSGHVWSAQIDHGLGH